MSEASTSSFLNTRTSYDYLYQAAIEIIGRTKALTNTQTITTVAGQANYNLNSDFLDVYLTDSQNLKIIKINDGTSDSFLSFRDYAALTLANNTTSTPIPYNFSIIDAPMVSRLTGTATSVGAASNGECTLTDTAADFTNVFAGDIIHNITDASDGVVIAKTSTTALVTALFEGSGNDWASSDSYVIVPQGRYRLVVDPPPSVAGYTITVKYVQLPDPVYSLYGSYGLPAQFRTALASYAAFLYKYSDREPMFGDALYKVYDNAVRRAAGITNDALRRKGFSVNLLKRANRYGSYR